MNELDERKVLEGAAVEAKATARYLEVLKQSGVPDAVAATLTLQWVSASKVMQAQIIASGKVCAACGAKRAEDQQ